MMINSGFIILCIVFGLLPYAAIDWALVELVLFVQRVIVKRDKFDKKTRKRTIILFIVSLLSIGLAYLLSFLFFKILENAFKWQ